MQYNILTFQVEYRRCTSYYLLKHCNVKKKFSAIDDLFHKIVKHATIAFNVQHNSVVLYVTETFARISSPWLAAGGYHLTLRVIRVVFFQN